MDRYGPRPARRWFRALAPALLLAGLLPELAAAAPGWRRLDVPASGTYALRYLPVSVDPASSTPVIVFLHGAGSRPEDWQAILAPLAEDLQFVLVLPRNESSLGFGPGRDDQTIAGALAQLDQELVRDTTRTAIAGHSAGAAYALVLAYQARSGMSGVFALSSPYRIVLSVVDPDYTPPIRMYYGTLDPNYQGTAYQALVEQWERLGVPHEDEIRAGFGHSSWPDSTLPDGFSFLLAQRRVTSFGCAPSDTRLCLAGGRFAVTGHWRDFADRVGPAHVVPLGSGDSGLLWFFQDANWEVMLKVLNGCANNGRWWILGSASTNVEYSLEVEDLETGQKQTYTNPRGRLSPAFADLTTFTGCP